MVFKANVKLFNYICQFWTVNHVSVKIETCLYSHRGCMPHCLFIFPSIMVLLRATSSIPWCHSAHFVLKYTPGENVGSILVTTPLLIIHL